MDNGVKTVNAELHTNTPLCPANATGHETYRLAEEWHHGLVPCRHFAVPAKRKNANYVPGCD
jgi:hypothetical protein